MFRRRTRSVNNITPKRKITVDPWDIENHHLPLGSKLPFFVMGDRRITIVTTTWLNGNISPESESKPSLYVYPRWKYNHSLWSQPVGHKNTTHSSTLWGQQYKEEVRTVSFVKWKEKDGEFLVYISVERNKGSICQHWRPLFSHFLRSLRIDLTFMGLTNNCDHVFVKLFLSLRMSCLLQPSYPGYPYLSFGGWFET